MRKPSCHEFTAELYNRLHVSGVRLSIIGSLFGNRWSIHVEDIITQQHGKTRKSDLTETWLIPFGQLAAIIYDRVYLFSDLFLISRGWLVAHSRPVLA